MSRRRAIVVGLGIALGGVAAAAITITAIGGFPTSAHAGTTSQNTSHDQSVVSAKPKPAALRVVAVGAATSTRGAIHDGRISVLFSAPISALPAITINPAFAGSWEISGTSEATFVPTGAPLPDATEHVTVAAGVLDTAGGALASPYSFAWTNTGGSLTRLQQLLAETGYLPLSFHPSTVEPTTAAGVADTAYAPVAGTYTWRFTTPSTLQALWAVGQNTAVTRGAVLAFEVEHELAADGNAGPAVWSALIADAAARKVTTRAYTYVAVTKARPETLKVWSNGKVILTTPANTGVIGATTPDGSWPVYARFTSETMSGTNPDGTKYHDPGVPWINYFYGGDAVHGFPRADYGFPQSVGCVELPIPTAKVVFGEIGYGTVVTVSG